MIPEDYEARVTRGEKLSYVLKDRTAEDDARVIDAVMLWLEHATTVSPAVSPTVALSLLAIELPDYANDVRLLEAVHGERDRRLRRGGRDTYFGPLLQDQGGRYELIDRIGQGGQGEVFRAIDRRFRGATRSLVAIKLFSRETTFEGVRARSVDHPNVVHVYDEGVDERAGRPFIVYEYLEGRRLDEWAYDRQMRGTEIAKLMLDLCEGVSAIHRSMIVHRDIKPSNIMISGDRPVIMDFGIAVEGLDDWNAAGTPRLLAPELRSGGGGSTLVDVFGLGVVLYYLLSGTFPGSESDEHIDTPGAVRDVRLWAIARKCIETVPGDRYQSSDRLAHDLHAYLGRRPLAGVHEHFFRRAHLRLTRRPLVSLLLALLAVGAGWVIWDQQSQIGAGSQEQEALHDRLAESLGRTKLLELANGYSQRVIHDSILDMRLRGHEIDPAMYWAIAKMGDEVGWKEWSHSALVSAEGAEMLRFEVDRRTNDPDESRLTIAYWWWLLARVESKTDGVSRQQVLKAYATAREYFISGLGEEDPLVGQLDEEIDVFEGEG